MLDLEIYSMGNGEPCKDDRICVLESSFVMEDEDRSQCHQLKLPLIFQAKNGENLYYKSIIYLEKKGGGQFDTFGDFVTEGALSQDKPH